MQLFVFEGLNCMDKQTFTMYYSVFKNLTLSVWNAHCTLMFMPANICTNVHTNVQCTYVQRSKPCSPLFFTSKSSYTVQYCTFCSFKSIFIYCTVHVLYCTYCTRKSMYGYTNSTVHCTVHIVQILVEYLSVYIACDAERVYYHNNSITASPPYQEGSATAEGVREQDFISQEKRVNSAAAQ